MASEDGVCRLLLDDKDDDACRLLLDDRDDVASMIESLHLDSEGGACRLLLDDKDDVVTSMNESLCYAPRLILMT